MHFLAQSVISQKWINNKKQYKQKLKVLFQWQFLFQNFILLLSTLPSIWLIFYLLNCYLPFFVSHRWIDSILQSDFYSMIEWKEIWKGNFIIFFLCLMYFLFFSYVRLRMFSFLFFFLLKWNLKRVWVYFSYLSIFLYAKAKNKTSFLSPFICVISFMCFKVISLQVPESIWCVST